MNSVARPWTGFLPWLAGAALVIGVIARFKGLGFAPFAVDEYYLAQSIEGVLRSGLPTFECGGLYTRGLILQYLSAGLQLAGLSGELAPRLLCAICSLAAFPAAYLLGVRIRGRTVGMLAVTLLALSVWEIEMARFGRMYAPFQALFLWYLVYFLRYVVDREARALWVMLALSVAGPFVWEGGIFLLLANLLPVVLRQPAGKFTGKDWLQIGAGVILSALAFAFLRHDFRGISHDALPPGFSFDDVRGLVDPVSTLRAPLVELPHHAGWLAVAAAALAGAVWLSAGWIWACRSRPLAALGLLATLLAVSVHQFLLAGALILLLLLMRVATWRELGSREARRFRIAVGALAVFWLVFGLTTLHGQHAQGGGLLRGLALLGYQFLRFPDVIGVVVRPWVWAVPHLGAALLVLCAVAIARMARSSEALTAERVLLVVFLVLLLAAGASHPPRQETRYVFFLYPLAILIALNTLTWGVDLVLRTPTLAATGLTAVALGGFALTEDFQPQHLRHIDTPTETFRTAMSPAMQSHLVIRDDYRSLAQWLHEHVPENAVVLNGVHGMDRYYDGIRYFYVEESSPNFPDWSCRKGSVERWGNYPLLYSVDSLTSAIGSGRTAYLVTFGYDSDAIMQSLSSLRPRVATSQGAIIVIELRG